MAAELSDEELEQLYASLATAIDELPESAARTFLTKLVILLALRVGEVDGVQEAIAAARRDL
jgi:hypothetical protein